MSTLTAFSESLQFDPLRDKRYQATRLGRDVADFLAWMELGGASPRTLDQYERDLARGCLMFPALAIDDWGETHLLHVARQFTAAERRVRMAAYQSFWKWARRSKRSDGERRRQGDNPMETLPVFKSPPPPEIEVFSDDEIDALCELPIRDGALMAVLFDTGLRAGEARHLQLRHVGPEKIRVRAEGSKGKRKRQIPATVGLLQKVNELALIEGLRPDDYLWYSRPGGGSLIKRSERVGETSFKAWWRRCLDEAGVDYRKQHTTRHTFATRWLRNGGRLSTLCMMLGHSSIKVTDDSYGHLDDRDLVADLELITRD